MRLARLGVLLCMTLLRPAIGQEPEPDTPPGRLPAWLHLGVEWRGRADIGSDFDRDADLGIYLNRLRLNATVRPSPWLSFVFQGQDARAFCPSAAAGCDSLRNPMDVRLAYLEAGRDERGLLLRIGRQELAVGDERLIGADTYWDVFGQSFDALRLAFSHGQFRAEAFAGYRVEPAVRRPDPLDTSNRIAGISLEWKNLQPYVLWKRGSSAWDLLNRSGHRDVIAPGIRFQGELPRGLEYNAEMVLERGHVVADRMAAWAGHWELGWRPMGRDEGPRLALEFNYASGDSNPRDGKHGTFDDMYPSGFNKFGMEDPIAWRNIRYPAVSAEIPLSKRWTAYAGLRAYWLAAVQDGLYPGGDECLLRNGSATSSHVGNQLLSAVAFTPSRRWRIGAGYGRLFAGVYLRQSGVPFGLHSLYLLSSLTL